MFQPLPFEDEEGHSEEDTSPNAVSDYGRYVLVEDLYVCVENLDDEDQSDS